MDPLLMARSAADANDRSLIQVIGRAAAILRALEGEKSGLSLAQIAERTGLARSTVQRIVGSLAAEKLLIAASPTGRVKLGPALLRLASSIEADFVSLVRPYIEKLSQDLEETVDLAVVKGDQMVFIDQIVGSHRLRAVSAVGEAFPLYCTANGKAYLAMLSDSDVARLIGKRLPRRTPHTLPTLPELMAELSRVRRKGFALDCEEHTIGICAAGVAMQDLLGEWVAVSVPVPTQRFHQKQHRIAEALLTTRATIQKQLGIAPS